MLIILHVVFFSGMSFFSFTGVSGTAQAAPGEALILDTTVSGGLSSLEADATVAAGKTPVVVDGATWGSMIAGDFADYDAIILGDPSCSTNLISYKAAFLRAGELKILSKKLSKNLALSAGLGNILVHEYEEIDYNIVHKSIPAAIRDFKTLIKELS